MEGREQAIQYLTGVKRNLLAQREKLLLPLRELDKDIERISEALAVVLRNEPLQENALGFPIKKLKGLTQIRAVIEIAKYNGGTVKTAEAKPILIGAGIMRHTKNSSRMIQGVIARSEAFERIGRGEYRLKQAPPLKGDVTVGELHFHPPVQ